MMEEERQEFKIFNKVEGNNGKLNDVIIFYQNVTAKYNVIYFGGDAQVLTASFIVKCIQLK